MTAMRLATHLGFRTGARGTLTSRTIMLAELTTLLASVPASASKAERRSAIVSENVLGKKTTSTRKSTAQRLCELYALDPSVPLFRLLQVFWKNDPAGQPLLALLCASARDPLLRMTAGPVLQARQGDIVATKHFEEAVARQARDRFTPSTLQTIARNAASSWTQSGHLSGRRVKQKSTPHVSAANTAYALLLGFLCGVRGPLLFHTLWTDLIEAPEYRLHELARQASSWGWLTYRSVGTIVEINFSCLLTSQERNALGE